MPGDQIPHSVLPPTEGGQLNIMANSQLLTSLTTDPWGYKWPIEPAATAAWLVKDTESTILPLCYGQPGHHIPLTKEEVLSLFESYQFNYCC
jgi:hypothetical protein